MRLHNANAEIFVPDHLPVEEAMGRVTHLGIGAHQDDLEFMAYHGIVECFQRPDLWFGGVTCTDGAGSARTGPYAHFTDAQMQDVRRAEQRAAAVVGGYGFMAQLDYPSRAVKDPAGRALAEDLAAVVARCRPQVVYTHNPADKHDTHIGVLVATLEALRSLPREARPRKFYGCEVWRDLDWMGDGEKVVLDCSARPSFAAALAGIFDSQIAGGKRYDLAVAGRRAANATFFQSHSTDAATALSFAMDLTPLLEDDTRDLADFAGEAIARFHTDVTGRLRARLGR